VRLEGRHGRPIGIAFATLVLAAAVAGAAAAAILAHSATKASRITVTEREYRLTLSRSTFKPGTVTFAVMNRGKLRHSLAIRGPGVSRRVRGTIAPGAERTLVVHLSRGMYTLWCPVPGHAAMGMKTTIRSAASTSSAATTTTGTTTGSGWG
jgi:plastocyanin